MKMINRVKFILVITVLSSVYFGSIAFANEAAFLDAESLIEGWKAQYGGIERMHFMLSEKVIDGGESKEGPLKRGDLIKFKMGEMTVDKDTKRFHLKYSREEDGLDDPLNIHEIAFDGEVTRHYWGSGPRKRGRISPGLRGNPGITEKTLEKYLLHFNIGYKQQDGQFKRVAFMDRLSDMSKSADNSIVVKQNLEMVSNEKCHVMEVGEKGKPNFKIWFAHGKGMLPMKYQSFIDTGDVFKEMVVTETSKVETETGVTWYPSKANLTQPFFEQDDSGTSIMNGKIKYELEVFKFIPNVELDESTFQFEFPAGTEVRDEVAGGLDYTVGYPKSGSRDYLNDREFLENLGTLKAEGSNQTPRASQSEVATDGDSHNQVEKVSINNVAKNDLLASKNKKVNVKNLLYCFFFICLLVTIVMLVKCKKVKEND